MPTPLDALARLFPDVAERPVARRSAIGLLRRIRPDAWPDYRAKAEQIARRAHRFRSAWAVWYAWARRELDGRRRWHEVGDDRRRLLDRADELRAQEASEGRRFVAGLARQLAGGMVA